MSKKTAILAASFGTSFADSLELTIGAIEKDIAAAFPGIEVRRAFTSSVVRGILKESYGIETDGVSEALEKMINDGVKRVYVQPTHLMKGIEYGGLVDVIKNFADKFDKIILSEPLFSNEDDLERIISAITGKTAEYDDGETAVCFMGHGTETEANKVYAVLQDRLWADGYENYFIGTVEAEPSVNDVIRTIKAKKTYKRAVLEPLMVVAGDHANNDMAGGGEKSWKTAFEREGFKTVCIVEGLGQIGAVRDIYIDHLSAAVENDEAFKAGNTENAVKTTAPADGMYLISAESDSPMFRIKKAVLKVNGGKMNAVLTLGGKGYERLFAGTAEEAGKSDISITVPFTADENGDYAYTLPVSALDKEIDIAALSVRKKEWYGRKVKFISSTARRISETGGEAERCPE